MRIFLFRGSYLMVLLVPFINISLYLILFLSFVSSCALSLEFAFPPSIYFCITFLFYSLHHLWFLFCFLILRNISSTLPLHLTFSPCVLFFITFLFYSLHHLLCPYFLFFSAFTNVLVLFPINLILSTSVLFFITFTLFIITCVLIFFSFPPSQNIRVPSLFSVPFIHFPLFRSLEPTRARFWTPG